MSADNVQLSPAPYSWLDKGFVQKALQSGEEDSTIAVKSCEVAMANAVGDGYASDMYRIKAILNNSQVCSLIVKCHPQGGAREEAIRSLSAFNTETRMLTETLPAMHEVLRRAIPGQFQPFSAKCLYSGDSPMKFIVMEDLKQSGFGLVKRQEGLDLEHSSLAIKKLAQFHASSIAVYEKDPAAIERYDGGFFNERCRKAIEPFFDNFIQFLEEEVRTWPGYEEYALKLQKLKGTYYNDLMKLCKRKHGEFHVLNHGDPWTSNMMFKYSDGKLEDIRFVDFQFSNFSSPGADLQYYLHTCPNDEVRLQHTNTLIQDYHNELTKLLNILGGSKHIISLTELHEIVRDFKIYGLVAAACILPIVLSNPEDKFDVEKSLSPDGDTSQNSKVFSNPRYVKVMKRLLPTFFDQSAL